MATDKRRLEVCLVRVAGFCLNPGQNNFMGN